MFQAEAGRRVAAMLAAAVLIEQPQAAHAQDAGATAQPAAPAPAPPPLDPSAPLDPMPDIGVEWPSMERGADATVEIAPAAAVADTAVERSYSLVIEGLDAAVEADVRARFDPVSTLLQHQDDESNAAQIDRRAREDGDLLLELLRARGYYDAVVETDVEAVEGTSGALRVFFRVEPGTLYRFAAISLPGIEAAGDQAAELRNAFGLQPNDPVDAERVLAAQAALAAELGRRGFAFADVGSLDVAVDHQTREATLTLPVTPNGERRFGRIIVEGRPLFGPGHIQTIARFRPGETFQADRIEDLRRALIATGLVSSVNVRAVQAQDPGTVDIAVSLERAPMRTISGQLGYGTGEGARLEISWQHRNLLPPEGAVTVHAVAGTQEQLLGATLRRNNFLRRDQVLTAQIAASHIDRAAYDARTFTMGAGLERQTNFIWQKIWTWSVGADLTATDERDVNIATGTTRRRAACPMTAPTTCSIRPRASACPDAFRPSSRCRPARSAMRGPSSTEASTAR